jgi:hypothetical protein
MNPHYVTQTGSGPVSYRIVVRGMVDSRFLEPLEMVSVEAAGVDTALYCLLRDQAELHGILSWLFDRGVEVISVNGCATPSGSQ